MKIPIKSRSLDFLLRNKIEEKEIYNERRSERGEIVGSSCIAAAAALMPIILGIGINAGLYSRDYTYYNKLNFLFLTPVILGVIGGVYSDLPLDSTWKRGLVGGLSSIVLEAASITAGYGIGYLLR